MIDFSLVDLPPDECRTLVDAGANAGQFLFAALAYYIDPRCLAIEMLPDMAAKLRENIPLSARERVTVVETAVGDHTGTARCLRSVHSEASSLLWLHPSAGAWYGMDLAQHESGTVPVRTLDSVCAEHGFDQVDLLKIDVQGYEDAVLRGAARTLAATRRLMIEVEFVPVYQGQAMADAIRTQVAAAGFQYVCNVTEYRSAAGVLLHADALFRRP